MKNTSSSSHVKTSHEPSWFFVVLVSGIISGVLLFTIGWFLTLPATQKDAVVQKLKSAGDIFPGMMGLNRSKILLVMGVDMPPSDSKDDYKYVRTDTMMLVRLDARRKKAYIVSIPRDCKVYIPGDRGVNKINAAFTLGGPELAVRTVERTLGVDVDNYLVVNTRGVREVVDALGGIEVFVEKPMHYRDRTAGLYINLEPGLQHLDGKSAEGFVRFRHDALGDIGRIRRQQQFVAAVASRLKDPATLLQIKPLVTASNKYILTDMSTQDLVSLVLFGKDLQQGDFQVATLPGRPSIYSAVSYWIIDPGSAETMLNRMILGLEEELTPLSVSRKPKVGILYTATHGQDLQVYQERLESEGFEVICKLMLRRTASKLITHNHRMERTLEQKLQRMTPVLQDAQLIFSPHGATFETNSCGHSDFTIILGDDTRSAAN